MSLLLGTRARDGGGRQNRGKTGLTAQKNEPEERKKPALEGPAQPMASAQAIAAFRVRQIAPLRKNPVFHSLTPIVRIL